MSTTTNFHKQQKTTASKSNIKIGLTVTKNRAKINLTRKLQLTAFIERFYCNRVYENGRTFSIFAAL